MARLPAFLISLAASLVIVGSALLPLDAWGETPLVATLPPAAPTVAFQSANFPGRFIRHRNFAGELTPIVSELDRLDALFLVRPALDGTPQARSLEAVNVPNHFLRHKNWKIVLAKNDGSNEFKKAASWVGLSGYRERPLAPIVTLTPVNQPFIFVRHSAFKLILSAVQIGSPQLVQDATFMFIPGDALMTDAPAGALSFEASNVPGQYMRHRSNEGVISPVESALDRLDANFLVRAGLNRAFGAISFESVNHPGNFLRHQNFRIKLQTNDGSQQFRDDASFFPSRCEETHCRTNFRASKLPDHYIRHKNFELWLSPLGEGIGSDHLWQIKSPR